MSEQYCCDVAADGGVCMCRPNPHTLAEVELIEDRIAAWREAEAGEEDAEVLQELARAVLQDTNVIRGCDKCDHVDDRTNIRHLAREVRRLHKERNDEFALGSGYHRRWVKATEERDALRAASNSALEALQSSADGDCNLCGMPGGENKRCSACTAIMHLAALDGETEDNYE